MLIVTGQPATVGQNHETALKHDRKGSASQRRDVTYKTLSSVLRFYSCTVTYVTLMGSFIDKVAQIITPYTPPKKGVETRIR